MNEYVLFIYFFKEVDVDLHKNLCIEVDEKFDECVFHYIDKEESELKVCFKSYDEIDVVQKIVDGITEDYSFIVEKNSLISVS